MKAFKIMVAASFVLVLATLPVTAANPSFTEGFDDITTLSAAGWVIDNNSTTIGSTSWGPIAVLSPRDQDSRFQGNASVFTAHTGATTSYIGDNYNATTGSNTISDWLISPQVTFINGDTISFYTRVSASPQTYPDRLELRLSTNGASVNCGTLATDVGDFTTLLLSVNPTLLTTGYPGTWTQYTATISGPRPRRADVSRSATS